MPIEVSYQTPFGLPASRIRLIGKTVFQGEDVKRDRVISLVFVDHAFMTEINKAYFHKNESTDVISFLLNDDFPGEAKSPWGEIYICVDRAREQADDYQVTLENEITRLLVHGLLHLIGYSDETMEDRKRMTELENRYLKQVEQC
jgi:probable rRNA maturation factor